jgi:hypothetical protein
MSLEQAIQANTAALEKLIVALGNQPAPPQPAAAELAKAPPAATQSVATEVTYAVVSAAVTRLSKEKGRAAAVDLLAKYGAKNLKEIDASNWAGVLADVAGALS